MANPANALNSASLNSKFLEYVNEPRDAKVINDPKVNQVYEEHVFKVPALPQRKWPVFSENIFDKDDIDSPASSEEAATTSQEEVIEVERNEVALILTQDLQEGVTNAQNQVAPDAEGENLVDESTE